MKLITEEFEALFKDYPLYSQEHEKDPLVFTSRMMSSFIRVRLIPCFRNKLQCQCRCFDLISGQSYMLHGSILDAESRMPTLYKSNQ